MSSSDLELKFAKSIEYLKSELATIRTGRATPALLENINVNAYEGKMTVKELASISVLDSQTLAISPWDKGLIRDIAFAINTGDLKVNAVVDGAVIRVPIPALTEERRKEFTKIVSIKAEECKNSLRNIRQDAKKEVERAFGDKTIGEDEKFSRIDEIEKIIKEYSEMVDELAENKKNDLMRV